MKTKIKSLEEKRIIIDGGIGEIHIAECSDGIWDISISEMEENKLRVGIPDNQGNRHFMFWKEIKQLECPNCGFHMSKEKEGREKG